MMGLFLGRAVGPAMFAGLIAGSLVGALIIARLGAKEGRKTDDPVRPVPRARAASSACSRRRDRRRVPRAPSTERPLRAARPARALALKWSWRGADKRSVMHSAPPEPTGCHEGRQPPAAGHSRRRQGAGRARPSSSDDSSGIGAFALLGGLAVAVARRRRRRAGRQRHQGPRGPAAPASPPQQQQIAGPRRRAEALRRLRPARLRARRHGEGPRRAPLRLGAGAARPLARAARPTSTLSEHRPATSPRTPVAAAARPLRGAISRAGHHARRAAPRNQRSVARLMARLRNVDGVTRVSLAKSEKTDTGSGSSGGAGSAVPTAAPDRVDAAAPRRAVRLRASRPQFEIVIFFEGQADGGRRPQRHAARARRPPAPPASRPPRPPRPRPRRARRRRTPAAGGPPSTPPRPPAAGDTPTTQGGVAP